MVGASKNLSEQGGEKDDLENGGGAELAKKSPISWWEFYLFAPAFIIPDILDLLSLTGIGVVFSWIADLIYLAVSNIWLYWKGRKLTWNLIISGLEFIPGIDVLPMRTIAFCVLIFLEKAPKKVKQAAKVAAEVAITTQAGGAGKIVQKVVAPKVADIFNESDSSSK